MTHIVDPVHFASKAKLQEALNQPQGISIIEPTPWGDKRFNSNDLLVGFKQVVTNHPLRTKFAQVEKTPMGWRVK